jgi:hypothetical protein
MMIEIRREQLKEIAEYLDMGMACFYNKTNGELETYPYDLEHSGLEEEWAEVTGKIEAFPDQYFQIEQMRPRESFEVIEAFVAEIDNIPTRKKFSGIISGKKPFANFKNMLSNYPDLREQWFTFKLARYIEFVKKQIEAFNLINDPIKGFYLHLEYHLTETLQNSPDKEIARLWCDGVIAVDNPPSIQSAIEAKRIEMQAIMGQSGHTVQEKYQMTIKLGRDAIKQYKNGLSMVDCFPDTDSLDWVTIDTEKKTIELQLH